MKVEIYTTPTCGWCNVAKDYFVKQNIDFIEYDVSKDTNKAVEMVNKSKQRGVPVIDINDNIIIGFDKEAIDKLLGIN